MLYNVFADTDVTKKETIEQAPPDNSAKPDKECIGKFVIEILGM